MVNRGFGNEFLEVTTTIQAKKKNNKLTSKIK